MREVGGDLSGTARSQNFLYDEDLATLLARARRLSVTQAADILIPVLSALASAHDAGSVHGDLRPRNIVLSQRGDARVSYVIGFGSLLHPDRSAERTPEGKVRMYLAPEQTVEGGAVDARSDQFAFGAVLYECLTGEPPFVSDSDYEVMARIVEGNYRKPRALEPTVPRALEAIIARTLAKRPERRFAGMRDLGAALLPFASKPVQLAYVAELGPSMSPRRKGLGSAKQSTGGVASFGAQRRERASVAAGALVIVALLAIGARRSDHPLESAPPQSARPESAPPAAPAPTHTPASPSAKDRAATNERPEVDDDVPVPTAPPTRAPVIATSAPDVLDIDLSVEPQGAWITLDRKAAGSGRLQRTLAVDGKVHEIRVGAPGYQVQLVRFKDAPPPKSLSLEKKAAR